jgi:hypothetical protein
MSNVDNLTKQDIEWLLNDYNRIRGHGKVNSWIDWHIKAQALIKGGAQKPDCSCMWVAAARIANSMYEQHEAELRAKLITLETPVIENDTTGIDRSPKKRGKRVRKENTGEGS